MKEIKYYISDDESKQSPVVEQYIDDELDRKRMITLDRYLDELNEQVDKRQTLISKINEICNKR